MRNVLRNHNEVAHYWANKTQASGRAGNMFFTGDTIYSYGNHFPIARHCDEGVILFTTQNYSVSTSQHKSIVRHAIGYDHPRVLYVLDVTARYERDHWLNLRALQSEIEETTGKMQRARKYQAMHAERVVELIDTHNRYVDIFHVGEHVANATQAREVAERYQRETEERRVREQAEHDARMAESMARWVAGEQDAAPHTSTIRLRLKDDEIQTSWGASIPVMHGVRLWHILESLRGQDLRGAAHSIRLGVYRLDEVSPDGDIKAGCHHIAYAELARIASLLNIPVLQEV